MRHVVEVRDAGGRFVDLFDFLERVDPRQVNKRAIENLARAGAFDLMHPNRAQIVDSSDMLIAYAQSVAAERDSAQVSLFGADQAEAARPRLPRRDPWNGIDQLDEELSAVGFYLTGHPLEDMMKPLARKHVTPYIEALARAQSGVDAFRMAGVVRRKQERAGRSGDKFAFVTLSDPTGEYEVLFPPEILRKRRELLEAGLQVVIRVRAKAGDGEVRFFGDDAEPLDRAVEGAAAALRIHLQPRSAEIDALKRRLEQASSNSATGEVTLVAEIEGGREIEMKLPGKYALDAALRGALKTAPGVAFLEDV